MKCFITKRSIREVMGPNKYPLDYPVHFLFTEEDRSRIKAKFWEANRLGLSPEYRKVCATSRCTEGYNYKETLEEMDRAEEIDEKYYQLLIDVPCWNPVISLEKGLDIYLQTMKGTMSATDLNEKEAFESSMKFIDEYIDSLPEGRWERRENV
jgi:hypothetical protein